MFFWCLNMALTSSVGLTVRFKPYFLGDTIINEVSLRLLHKEDDEEKRKFLDDFDQLRGKKEHNICIFDKNYKTECQVIIPANHQRVHLKGKGKDPSSFKDAKHKTGAKQNQIRLKSHEVSPYESPEVVDSGFSPTDFSDMMTKADVFSLGMLLLRLVCYVTNEDFDRFSGLNQISDSAKYTSVLSEIINFCEKLQQPKIAQILVQMLDKDINERLHIDKLLQILKTKFGYMVVAHQPYCLGLNQQLRRWTTFRTNTLLKRF